MELSALTCSPLHQTAKQWPLNCAVKWLQRSAGESDGSADATSLNSDQQNLSANSNRPGRCQSINYQTLSLLVHKVAAQLTVLGAKQGDIIAAVSSNNLEQIVLFWACVDTGCIFMPISARFADSKIAELITEHEIKLVYCENAQRQSCLDKHVQVTWFMPEFSAGLNPETKVSANRTSNNANSISPKINDFDPQRPTNIVLTSGSSGKPKSALHSLANHIYSADGARETIALSDEDTWLLSLPLFHIGGLAIINRCALSGSAVMLQHGEHSIEQHIVAGKVTHLSLVTAQARSLLFETDSKTQQQSLTSIKAMLLGGGAITDDIIQACLANNIQAYTSYGMTEMSSQITTASANTLGHHGAPLKYRQLEIRDGVIWVKGECLFLGYWSKQGLHCPVDDNGWFNTKDKGYLNEHGQLSISGRADNMFICGGENIQPEEIEAVLVAHPNVRQAIVFGIKDTKFGLLPAAIIDYVNIQLQSSTDEELAQSVSNKLARFKRPRQFYPWPNNVASSGLKVARKQVVAAVLANSQA
ncbi:o-succinylbenzoate--CoA ligase [Shewanella maritima]|uniref:o-succinylbenzoate--CoA ligase n=1 Tax=Shewanella maritima TaxID=2520507 RepID=UPI001F5F7403|nr:o-succinylbenzoate--CoA ligase [Shewanella maritima]